VIQFAPFISLCAILGDTPGGQIRVAAFGDGSFNAMSDLLAHTLDLWRYLIPSTPMVALLLSMVCAELPGMLIASQKTLSLAGKKRS
jgi:hypothetical protein